MNTLITTATPWPERRWPALIRARERLVNCWKRLADAGNAECRALELSDLPAAEPTVVESAGKGLEQGQALCTITFPVPCKKVGGKGQAPVESQRVRG